jgi:hypothetical protein
MATTPTPAARADIEAEMREFRRSLFDMRLPHPSLGAASVRCHHFGAADRRCGALATKYACFCTRHAKQVYGLHIKRSTIPRAGEGLFALIEIPAHDTIDLYAGKVVQQHAEGNYTLTSDNGYAIDARARQSCVARYINHHPARANCEFVRFAPPGHHVQVIVRTVRNVRAGEELLIDYGPLYDESLRRQGLMA